MVGTSEEREQELIKEFQNFDGKNPNSKRKPALNRRQPIRTKNRNYNNERDRREKLIPDGVPRYVRVYDNRGLTADRYTVCFTGKYQIHLWKDRKLDEEVEVKTGICKHCSQHKYSHDFIPDSTGERAFCVKGNEEFESSVRMTTQRRPMRWLFFSMFDNGQVCNHGEHSERIDYPQYRHLGKPVKYQDLSKALQNTILREYEDLWFHKDEED